MKKIFLIVIFILIFSFCVNCFALSRWDTDKVIYSAMSDKIIEEMVPVHNEVGDLIGFRVLITIPSDYQEDEIVIVPSVFQTINNYKHLIPGEEVSIDLKVINHSKFDYQYVNNSFILSTDDLSRYGVDTTFSQNYGIGFDGNVIYDHFLVYRTCNEAIRSLYDNDFCDDALSDDILDVKLKDRGYSGVQQLSQYYLDFYNNKYNLKEDNLDEFTFSVAKEIFGGKISNIKESDPEIVRLSYHYFYNKLLYYKFSDQEIDSYNSDEFSIGNYKRKGIGNEYFKSGFQNIESGSFSEINHMKIGINDYYYSEIFNDYGLYGYMEFRLEKSGVIVPPNTGI